MNKRGSIIAWLRVVGLVGSLLLLGLLLLGQVQGRVALPLLLLIMVATTVLRLVQKKELKRQGVTRG